MELRKIWQIIWRGKWIVIQALLIISLTTIIGSYMVTPTYETSAKVLIKTSDATTSLLSKIGVSETSSMLTTTSGTETSIETYMKLATLDSVIKEVISRLQLRTRDENLMTPDELQEFTYLISTLFPEPYVEVEEAEDTDDMMEITATSPYPKEAAMIANTLAHVFIDKAQAWRKEEYINVRQFIEGQIIVARADYSKILEEIKSFKISEQTVDIDKETEKAIEKMKELMKEKEDNIIDISENRAKIETLKVQLNRWDTTVVSSSAISENPLIEELKKKINELELQMAGELTEKRQDHPDVKSLKERIEKAREELSKEVDTYKTSATELEALERELAALEVHLKGVNANIDKYLSLLYTIPEKVSHKSRLDLKLKATQELYSSLLEYLYEVEVAEAMTLSDIRLVEAATEPDIDDPKTPKKLLNGAIGVFLGLMFGLSLVFLRDYLDDTIKTPEEIKEQGITLLGYVPEFGKKESPIISQRDPKDPIAESYRTVRNSLKFATLDKPINSLLITSSLKDEGRTTTVVNLGISFAREGKKVLLIDTDLRRPAIHKLFGVSNSIGITSILAGEAKLEDAINSSGIEGLSLLTSGPVPPDPGRLIESEKMSQLIKDLDQRYDFVILDAPPILISHRDAVVLAGYVDGSILILESQKLTRRAFTQARESLKGAHIQPLGTVLNRYKINIKRGSSKTHYGG